MLHRSFTIAVTVSLTAIITCGVNPVHVLSAMFVPGQHVNEMTYTKVSNTPEPVKVKEEPICSPNKRPHIDAVEPDEVKPGDKMIVTGRFFGEKKECLYKVTIGSEEAENSTYISQEKLEVTVPDSVRPGMNFLNVQSGGGAARSAILVQRDK